MAGVEAQVHVLAVGAVEEAVHILLGVDVAVRVRVVLRLHAVLLEHLLAQLVHAAGLLLPLLCSEIAVLEHLAAARVAPHLRDHDHMLAAGGRGQLRDVLDLGPHGIPGVILMQVLEHGAGRQLQIVGREFVTELLRVGGQVAVRPQLDPLVTGCGDLVEEPTVRGLLGGLRGNQTPPGVGGRIRRE